MFLKHTRCGREVSIAVLNDDVALYVYCEHCRDLVEDGELDPKVDETQVCLRVDRWRVRCQTTGATVGREGGR